MIEREIARRQFKALVESGEDIDLSLAALLIAKEEYLDLDIAKYLDMLDEMAMELKSRIGQLSRPEDIVTSISQYLFYEKGFRGNHKNYYDPRNSFLNDVLDRKLGIPITLSLLYMELGRRVGVPIVGVGLPGRFLIRHTGVADGQFIDTFQDGSPIGIDHCKQLVDTIYGGKLSFREDLLNPVSRLDILRRVLNNLKAIYISKSDSRRALSVLERLVILSPDSTEELRDRGLFYLRLHAYSQALMDLNRYVENTPHASDYQQIQSIVDLLKRQRMN